MPRIRRTIAALCLLLGSLFHIAAPSAAHAESLLNPDRNPISAIKSQISDDSYNVLLLCTDDSRILYDTICLVNIDHGAGAVKLFMIPRDTYVPYGAEVSQKLKDAELYAVKGMMKLNALGIVADYTGYKAGKFKSARMTFFNDVMGEFFGITFQDYVIFNFDSFTQLIDTLGGVDITVKCDVRNSKGQLVLAAGKQHLTGQQALAYARMRKLYDENGKLLPSEGDFMRKAHQLDMIREILPQAFKVSNITKIPDILNSLKENVHHSLSAADIAKYSNIALKINARKYTIETVVIKGSFADPMGDGASYVVLEQAANG